MPPSESMTQFTSILSLPCSPVRNTSAHTNIKWMSLTFAFWTLVLHMCLHHSYKACQANCYGCLVDLILRDHYQHLTLHLCLGQQVQKVQQVHWNVSRVVWNTVMQCSFRDPAPNLELFYLERCCQSASDTWWALICVHAPSLLAEEWQEIFVSQVGPYIFTWVWISVQPQKALRRGT